MASPMTESREREFEFSDQDFRDLVVLVAERTGIALADHKRNMVYSRLAKRLRPLGLKTFRDYINYLKNDTQEDELGHFVNAVTTNLTHFFREDHHFNHLAEEVIAPLVKSPPPGRKIRLWSAGCSSGMEPYSIAMTLHHAIPNIDQWDVKILATDIDTNMLRTGHIGEYKAEELQNIPEAYRKKYLVNGGAGGTLKMVPELRRLIAFNHLNLLHEWPINGVFDAVFCRNVVIYFNKETQRLLFSRYANVMKPNSWLYIGHSENITTLTNDFKLVGRTVYRRV